MKAIAALSFYIGVLLVGLMPFFVLYGFSNIFRFFLHRVFGYRRKVIVENISNAFPNMSENEKKDLIKGIYQNISDVFLEGVKAFMLSRRQVIKRHKVLNPEILKPYLDAGRSVLGVTGHYANWEWGSLSASSQIDATIIAFYKKLSNHYIDGFVRSSRMKFGTILASIANTAQNFEKYINQKTVFVMAADQNPLGKNLDISYWNNFFGREIPFLYGPEKYSHLYNLPVFYIDIQRVKRGFYEVELSLLVENPTKLPAGEVTAIYVRKLEEAIRKKPESWLWSHRRWKFARQAQ